MYFALIVQRMIDGGMNAELSITALSVLIDVKLNTPLNVQRLETLQNKHRSRQQLFALSWLTPQPTNP
jgi:hypothetical protein